MTKKMLGKESKAATKRRSSQGRRRRPGLKAAEQFWSQKTIIALCVLVILTGIVYFHALKADHIWDDQAWKENALLRDVEGLKKIWLEPRANTHETHYWPLTYTMLWIEHQFWGTAPFGFHLVNLLLHIINAILLWQVLRRLGISWGYLAALLFALHPVHVESVAWVIELKDVFSGLFYLLAFLAYLRFERNKKWGIYVLSIILLACAMLTKSITISLPLALGIAIWWRDGTLRQRDYLRLAPLLALAAIIALCDVRFVQTLEGITFELSFIERILLASRSVWFYAQKIALPYPLMAVYLRWDIDAHNLALYIFPIALAALLIALWALRKHISRGPLAAVLFFCFTLGPTLGLIDFNFMIYTYVADRFQYLASIGLITLAAGLLYRHVIQPSPHIGYAVAGILCIVLGFLTFQHCKVFYNHRSLFEHNAKVNSRGWVAFNNLGDYAFKRGEINKAKQLFERALEIRPEYPEAHTNMGAVYARWGEYDKALYHYDRALEIRPKYPQAYNNKGTALARSGRISEAIECFKLAIKYKVSYIDPYKNLGVAYEDLNQYEQSVIWRKRGLQIDPMNPKLHFELANVLCMLNKFDEAIEHYSVTLKLRPDHEKAKIHLQKAREWKVKMERSKK